MALADFMLQSHMRNALHTRTVDSSYVCACQTLTMLKQGEIFLMLRSSNALSVSAAREIVGGIGEESAGLFKALVEGEYSKLAPVVPQSLDDLDRCIVHECLPSGTACVRYAQVP